MNPIIKKLVISFLLLAPRVPSGTSLVAFLVPVLPG